MSLGNAASVPPEQISEQDRGEAPPRLEHLRGGTPGNIEKLQQANPDDLFLLRAGLDRQSQ
jgi:hypothetical protein